MCVRVCVRVCVRARVRVRVRVCTCVCVCQCVRTRATGGLKICTYVIDSSVSIFSKRVFQVASTLVCRSVKIFRTDL